MKPNRPIIIAEAGVNHNGDEALALELVRAAKRAGADIVKFQHFRTETTVSAGAATAAYQAANTGSASQSDLLRDLELDLDAFARIAKACKNEGITFLCTPFDMESAADLVALGMPAIKIPSGEITNLPMLTAYARFELPIWLSTGMATMEEVSEAMTVLSAAGATEITLLQCTSLYPAPADTLNLNAMVTMHRRFNRPVGYSDHSLGDHASIAAVALGASLIEKHFTLDRNLPGPDHRASLEPDAFAAMVVRLHETHEMLGDGIKRPSPDEIETAKLVRRSWHTTRALDARHILTAPDVILKRPASGLAPDVDPIGLVLTSTLAADSPIMPADVQ